MDLSYLCHHGIKGQKWGRRRFQYKDGSLTPAGEKRYNDDVYEKKAAYKEAKSAYKTAKKEYDNSPEGKAKAAARRKKAIKIGAAVVGTALAAYGAYKVNQYVKTKNAQIAAKNGFDYANKVYQRNLSLSKNLSDASSGRMVIRSENGRRAIESANRARNDSFKTAAKNVINYKKSGGSLSGLHNVDFYREFDDFTVFEKKKR